MAGQYSFVCETNVMLNSGNGSRYITIAKHIQDFLMPTGCSLNKIWIGGITVQKKQVTLGAKPGPERDQTFVSACLIENVVKAQVKVGRYLF